MRSGNLLFALPIVLVPLSQSKSLIASTVFTALSLIEQLTVNINNFSFGLNSAADYYSVIKRTEEVLVLEEIRESPNQS